jgi:putative RecB family exonuclease
MAVTTPAPLAPTPTPVEVGDYQPTGLSPSGMGTYEKCPLSWYLHYVAQIPEPTGVEAIVGTFVHQVLEDLLGETPEHRTLDRAREIAAVHRAMLTDENPEFAALGLDDEEARVQRVRAWNCIIGYFRTEDPASIDVESCEQWVEVEVAGVPVRGCVDRLERDSNGGLQVVDYKSGKTPIPGFGSSRLRQLEIYALAVEATTGERASRLRLIFANDTDPTQIIGQVRESNLNATKAALRSVWDAIHADLAAGAFCATPNRLCDWCTFKPGCPAHDGDLNALLAQSPVDAVASSVTVRGS